MRLSKGGSGTAGGLGWRGRSMGQGLTALLPQEVHKEGHELVFVDRGLAEGQAAAALCKMQRKNESCNARRDLTPRPDVKKNRVNLK